MNFFYSEEYIISVHVEVMSVGRMPRSLQKGVVKWEVWNGSVSRCTLCRYQRCRIDVTETHKYPAQLGSLRQQDSALGRNVTVR